MPQQEIAVLALSSTGEPDEWDYVIAAAPIKPSVWSWSYWNHFLWDAADGDTFVLMRVKCDDDDAANLIVHGGGEQHFSDGYEAAGVVEDTQAWEIVKWYTHEGEPDDDDFDDDEAGEDDE